MGLQLFPADTSLAELENQAERQNNSYKWETGSGGKKINKKGVTGEVLVWGFRHELRAGLVWRCW